MSSIDSPDIIRKLIERKGSEPGMLYDGMRSTDDPRRDTKQIWQYTTGFGGICYKLIYGAYPGRMNDEEASRIFLGTANIKPGTTPTCIFHSGKLTAAGEKWWKDSWGMLPLPK